MAEPRFPNRLIPVVSDSKTLCSFRDISPGGGEIHSLGVPGGGGRQIDILKNDSMLFIIEAIGIYAIIMIKEVFMEEVAFELGLHLKNKHVLIIQQVLEIQR